MTILIIARHGNTFGPEDTVTYVGARTDLPLVEKGIGQAKAIGRYLKDNKLIPDAVYSSNLKRTIETAKIAIKETGISNPIFQLDIFNEIDYGPDENKTKDEILKRVGVQAHANWETNNIIPDGWKISAEEVIKNWRQFADQICAHDDNETVLVVTSNGIARFAPHITGDYESFRAAHTIKLATGALGILKHEDNLWTVQDWNIRP